LYDDLDDDDDDDYCMLSYHHCNYYHCHPGDDDSQKKSRNWRERWRVCHLCKEMVHNIAHHHWIQIKVVFVLFCTRNEFLFQSIVGVRSSD